MKPPARDPGERGAAEGRGAGGTASNQRALLVIAFGLLLLGLWRLTHPPGPDFVPVADEAGLEMRLDLNRASAAELEALPAIGPVLAARIAAHRARHGPFLKVEDLAAVPGLGAGKLRAIEPWVTVGP